MFSSSRSRVPELPRAGFVALLVALLIAAALTLQAMPGASAATADSAPPHLSKYFAGQLAGEARLTWFGFHVYDARLFVPASFSASDTERQSFALELTYGRSLEGRAIAETSRDEIARLGFGTEATRRQWYDQMVRIFPDVQRGQRIAGVNLPGRGVQFLFNGEENGRIEDAEFARAFFAIWLDPRTRSPDVRDGLLRGIAR
jgi:hypothetical protein